VGRPADSSSSSRGSIRISLKSIRESNLNSVGRFGFFFSSQFSLLFYPVGGNQKHLGWLDPTLS
jgi:hypothetical protein